ncbi:MAG: hypothetical protein OXI41_06240 [Chloroflexota bacterium]|nr:hypothetical protein [Chloroflexota bacterium]MDE2894508.1 hypothetical protein [Chloroflexota bacterium]
MTKQLSLDDDVAAALAEEAERRGVPADQLANEELRSRFCDRASVLRESPDLKTFPGGLRPEIAHLTPKQVLSELDDEWLEQKIRQ